MENAYLSHIYLPIYYYYLFYILETTYLEDSIYYEALVAVKNGQCENQGKNDVKSAKKSNEIEATVPLISATTTSMKPMNKVAREEINNICSNSKPDSFAENVLIINENSEMRKTRKVETNLIENDFKNEIINPGTDFYGGIDPESEVSSFTPSKIPVRQSKCTSWAGADTTPKQTATVESTYPYNPMLESSSTRADLHPRINKYFNSLENPSNIRDLTPGQ